MDQDNNINKLEGGIHQDNSLTDQPKGTVRFMLNASSESLEGDGNFIPNEESNEICVSLPVDYTPIGKEYIGNGQTAIFLVKNDGTASEIGILDSDCTYITHVNDLSQQEKLGFKLENQIDATYRLRRGCEKTIYFVDRGNNPRYYDFNSPEKFKVAGLWSPEKFKLFKTFNDVPNVENIEVLETGLLLPGSYNFAVQYLDEDLNPTEWTTTTDTIIIYNDSFTSKPFSEVRGSTNKKTFYQDYGVTNKAIRLTLGNLNTDFPFYRIAAIEATSGTGIVSRVMFSLEISTDIRVYTYTGENGSVQGTEQEILQFNTVIDAVENIEQIENRLTLHKVKGKQVNFCRLQKYASRITTDLVTEEIVLNNMQTPNNPKRAQLHYEKVGYMPGEIYSFGIVYIFDDGSVSPTYHIPGKAADHPSTMSSDNIIQDVFYTDNNPCGVEDYWGSDSQGTNLTGTLVRHHRFPLRSEVNLPLFTRESGSLDGSSVATNNLYIDIGNGALGSTVVGPIEYIITYEIDAVQSQIQKSVSNVPPEGVQDIFIVSSLDTITYISVQEIDGGVPGPIFSGLSYTADFKVTQSVSEDAVYRSKMFGIQFKNINIPTAEAIGDETIVGYYIVRNERNEDNKTILDSGVLSPLLVEKAKVGNTDKFVATGHLMPTTTRMKTDILALIHPEHKFNNKEYKNTTQYLLEGEYYIESKNYGTVLTQDVMPGTSYDSSVNKRRERDSDGFTLHNYIRNNNVAFSQKREVFAETADITETFYLDTLFSKVVTDTASERKEVFNLSSDNKTGILQLNKNIDIADITNKLPYVVMKRNLSSPYGGFRVLPYYKEHLNPQIFSTPTGNISNPVYNGDSYIGSMKYISTMFYDVRLRERRTKSGFFNFVLGALAIIAGALITIFSVGTAAAAGIAIAGFGLTQITTGLKKDQLARVYQDLYEQGLKDTVEDDDTAAEFDPNPEDDEVQWFQDSITNLWFETGVNINWRMGNTIGLTDFINSPTGYDQGVFESYAVEKVTSLDPEADGGRTYQGYCKAEIYEVNTDFKRRDRQKIYPHLGIEYDCCSDCVEDFPHRSHYSEQSFQEELTDNYRVFLPNNYRDLEGETGTIVNVVRLQNNLFIHTQEALWHLPQNIQERVTGEVLSFIGTGDFFSIPPRKIVDDQTGHSAGIQHKWDVLKTPHGVFFISESQSSIFRFDGKQLKPISSKGLFSSFKKNISIATDRDYYITNKRSYPFRDNPSNPYGTGFISVYDSRKERVIFTKKDFLFTQSEIVNSTDYELCVSNNNIVLFENYQQVIDTQEIAGWEFVGVESIDKYKIRIEDTATLIDTYFNGVNPFGQVLLNWLGTIDGFSVKLKTKGSPDFDLKAYIYSVDGSNHPDTVLQTSSTTIVASSLTTQDQWIRFTFDGTSYNQTIAIVIVQENIVLSTSSDAVITSFDTVGYNAIYPVVFSNNNGTTWSVSGDTSLQMILDVGDLGDCQMVFQKLTTTTSQIEVDVVISNSADVIVQLDMSGSFDNAARTSIRDAAIAWKANFQSSNPNWTGELYFSEHSNAGTSEKWLLSIGWVLAYTDIFDVTATPVTSGISNEIVIVSFVNENSAIYHPTDISPTFVNSEATYAGDYTQFVADHTTLLASGGSFSGLIYPIVMTPAATGQWNDTNGFLQHVLQALKGGSYTVTERNIINSQVNSFCPKWTTDLMPSLTTFNPYSIFGAGLETYGWNGIFNRGWDNSGDPVITDSQFQVDMDEFLQGQSSTEVVSVQVAALDNLFIQGTTLNSPTTIDKSWTISYSLKKDSWRSWHSYLPNFYIHTSDRFYSWVQGNTNLWKHNVLGNYQNYYGVRHPFIIEYVSLKNPINTGIWDFIKLLTEARKYDSTTNEFKEERFVTFNKAVFYNSRQASGEVTLQAKDTVLNPEDYLQQQVSDNDNSIVVIDRNEKDWTINDLRDIRIDYNNPIWDSSSNSVQPEYYIDKILNISTMDVNKDPYELESFRDKYLVIRLIFDTFDDVKLIFNYSIEEETESHR